MQKIVEQTWGPGFSDILALYSDSPKAVKNTIQVLGQVCNSVQYNAKDKQVSNMLGQCMNRCPQPKSPFSVLTEKKVWNQTFLRKIKTKFLKGISRVQTPFSVSLSLLKYWNFLSNNIGSPYSPKVKCQCSDQYNMHMPHV